MAKQESETGKNLDPKYGKQLIELMLHPLQDQQDGGLGSIGESYLQAATTLMDTGGDAKLAAPNAHLPINFLLRHSIELFMKSSIMIIHQALVLPDKESHEPIPKIQVNGKPQPLPRVHNLLALYDHFQSIYDGNLDQLQAMGMTKWKALPEPFKATIDRVHSRDPASTYFRYPNLQAPDQDASKSSFKHKSADELAAMLQEKEKAHYVLTYIDADGQIVKGLALDKAPEKLLRDNLIAAAEFLRGVYLMVYIELGHKIR